MSEKAKAMMERLKNSPGSMENGKFDANVNHFLNEIILIHIFSKNVCIFVVV